MERKHHYQRVEVKHNPCHIFFLSEHSDGRRYLHELEENPDEYQPGSGFYNWYMDSDGRVEYLRLVRCQKENELYWQFDPPAEYLDPKKLNTWFKED